ncbi:hypothetical protein BSK62_18915 [Paenibacillus odorifer]|uniref:hypothetical protein n=1 Tax=Paenibacillus TaxID=44249 RepID=UPI00096CD9AE|nr:MULTISPECIES: hypothetical protein [Paenibacillus]MDH6429812.1 hypothetical protein [Paenibacillus sp. PastH-4]MDH6446088.1 hypothetical protein [Paenibacillus sp. PastF-4]MDH6530443.1 hypothetical protein [Paenibacillus sp. PastH-3]OMD63855.1 hypothetical protein BSK62_18915 [Paenibacillus odorifer]
MNDHNLTFVAKAKMMLVYPLLLALIVILVVSSLTACDNSTAGKTASKSAQPTIVAPVVAQASGSIYLYGEAHGVAKILDKEYKLWSQYYHNEGMRHLFVELPYFTAEYLNLWMQSDNDDILEEIYDDWERTRSHNPDVKEFYKKIKSECPETIFHGTDIGHQYETTGSRYLSYLVANDLGESQKYTLTMEAIRQGRVFYSKEDGVYREDTMTENFIREFEKLGNESVMGIYGSAHTGLDEMDYKTQSIPCMGNQLQEHYGDNIYSENLSWIAKDIEPSRVDYISLQGKEYAASYFGKQDLNGFKDYAYREFWRLEDAYEDIKDLPLVDNYLPYDNYLMPIEVGQVFVVNSTKTDGSVQRDYYLSSGQVVEGVNSTQQFTAE